uniref:MARVEL domain-containing protein n=1 Tax=Syphacia muris TaxID=451379 RepID=A0A0N5AK85_9BILA
MPSLIQSPSTAAAQCNILPPSFNDLYRCRSVRLYEFSLCTYRIRVERAATLSIIVSYVSYIALSLLICVSLWHPLPFITLPIGFLMLINTLCAYRLKNHWFLLAYINFLVMYLIAILVAIGFAVRSLQKSVKQENQQHLKTLIAVAAISFFLNALCIYAMVQLYKLFRRFRSEPPSMHQLNRNIARAVAMNRRQLPCNAPICVISYPPPCPPAYEAEPSTSNNSNNFASNNQRHRPRRKALRRNITQVILPQYTDFRPEVYAEPPPYEEKPEIGNYI